MSKHAFEHLSNSVLFDDRFLSGTYSCSEEELNKAVSSYIAFCGAIGDRISDELRKYHDEGIRVFKNVTNINKLEVNEVAINSIVQDLLILPDPLFEYVCRAEAMNKAHKDYLGIRAEFSEQEHIRRICKKLKDLSPFVHHDFLKFIPLTDPSQKKVIPVLYSPSSFSEYFEDEVLRWFHARSNVYPMTKSERGPLIHRKSRLTPTRMICVEFDESEGEGASFYTLSDPQIEIDNLSGFGTIEMRMPSAPPDEETFKHWVNQSINQSAKAQLDSLKNEMKYAKSLNAIISPRSIFAVKMIRSLFSVSKFASLNKYENAAINLKLNLPVNTNMSTFMKMREDHNAFNSFRNHVRNSYFEMQGKSDQPDLERFAREMSAEFSHKHVPEIKQELKNLKFSQTYKWLSIASTFGVAVNSPEHANLLWCLSLGLLMKGFQGTHEELVKVKSNPGYFWSQISK